jgi:hypothetical protein
MERMLADLGVTEGQLLYRAMALDKAAAQLIAEAADRTALNAGIAQSSAQPPPPLQTRSHATYSQLNSSLGLS